MKKSEVIANSLEPQARRAVQNGRQIRPVRRFLSGARWAVPLAWQLSVLYAVLLMLTLSVVGWLVYAQQEGFLMQDTGQRLVLQAERIASISQLPQDAHEGRGGSRSGSGIANSRDDHSGNTLDNLVYNLVQGLSGPGITVAVLNSSGTLLSATQALGSQGAPVVGPVNAEQVNRALNTRQPVQWTVKGADGTRQVVVLTAVTPQTTPDQGEAVNLLVEQVASLAAVDAALGQLRLLLLLGVLGGTLVGVALVLAFTRGVLRPLERVVDTADAISAGDLHRRLALPRGRSEVARLGKSFDSMVGRLVATLENQRRFVADASHELRTPLTSLKGLAEILVIGAHGNDTRVIEQSARAINSELERLIRLVADLLTLSRLDNAGANPGDGSAVTNGGSPMIGPKRAAMDACETIQAAAGQMAGIAAARNVQLSYECADALPMLGDAGQMKQVLLNLLDNALRYTPDGGRVILRGTLDSGSATIQVRDTGRGIPPKDLPHIFERFYRGDTSRSRATGNSGLGLAIAKSILDAHGGNIEVQSQPGEGACFTVKLPLAHAAHPPSSREGQLAQAGSPGDYSTHPTGR